MTQQDIQAYTEYYQREKNLLYKGLERSGDCLMFLFILNSDMPEDCKQLAEDNFYKAHKAYGNLPALYLENAETLPHSHTANQMQEIVSMANREVVAIVENPELIIIKDNLIKEVLRNKFDAGTIGTSTDIIILADRLGYKELAAEMENDLKIGK